MKLDIIHVPSVWGTELKQKHFTVQEGNNKLVILFPGWNYPCELPLLYYAGNAALQQKYDVLNLEYGYQAARTNLDKKDLPIVIDECCESINRIITNYDQVIFISKSLGTIIAGEVHRRLLFNVYHVFLTPLAGTIPFINTSDGIVIYGGNDPSFTKDNAAQIEERQKTIEIPGANHGLETGNVEENLSILKNVVDTYKKILTERDSR